MIRLLIFIPGLLVVAILTLLVGPNLVDWNKYKPEIAAFIEQETGRKFAIGGEIGFRVLPAPRLSASDVVLTNRPDGNFGTGGASGDFARVESLEIEVALAPLLSGSVQISSVTLVGPALSLTRNAEGRVNWDFPSLAGKLWGPGAGADTRSGSGVKIARDGLAKEFRISLDQAKIISGTLVWRDEGSGVVHRIDGLRATLTAASRDGPFKGEGRLNWRGEEIAFKASVGKLGGRDSASPVQVMANLELAQDAGAIRFDGAVSLPEAAEPEATGTMTLETENAARFLARVSRLAGRPVTLPAVLGQPLTASVALRASPVALEADGLVADFGKTRIQGDVSASTTPKPVVKIDLALGLLNLDDILASRGAEVDEGGAPAGDSLALPADLEALVDFRMDAVIFKGRTIRHPRFQAEIRQGRMQNALLEARFPGDTDMVVRGAIDDLAAPRFVGRGEITSNNLREALRWLKIPLGPLAPGRLRRASLGSALEISRDQFSLTDLAVTFDSTRIDGGLALSFAAGEPAPKPVFDLHLGLDRINIDAYAPLPSQSPEAGEGEKSAAVLGAALGDALGGGGLKIGGFKIGSLAERFDGTVALKVGEVIWRGEAVRDAHLNAVLTEGRVALRDFGAADMAGTKMRVTGAPAPAGAPTPVVRATTLDLMILAEAQSAAGLIRLVGLSDEIWGGMRAEAFADEVGAFTLRSRLFGSGGAFDIDGTLEALGGHYSAKGRFAWPDAGPDSGPAVNLVMRLTHPDATAAAQRLDLDLPELGAALVTAHLVSGPGGRMAVTAEADLASGRITLDGDVQPYQTHPSIAASLAVTHPDLAALMRLGGVTDSVAGEALGPVALTAEIAGDMRALSLREIKAEVGPLVVRGAAQARLDGTRPDITLTLAASPITLDRWLPAQAQKKARKKDGPPDWSRAPLDFSFLSSFDGALTVTAEQVVSKSWTAQNLAFDLGLRDGVVRLQNLDAALFGGQVHGVGEIAGGPVPRFDLGVTVERVDLSQLADSPVSGMIDAKMAWRSQGHSHYALISDMSGDGRFTIRKGAVREIDLARIGGAIDTPGPAADVPALLQAALSSGATEFGTMQGSWRVNAGLLQSDDITFVGEGAMGQGKATLNLPDDHLQASGQLQLPAHPQAPAIGLDYAGPPTQAMRRSDAKALQTWMQSRAAQQ